MLCVHLLYLKKKDTRKFSNLQPNNAKRGGVFSMQLGHSFTHSREGWGGQWLQSERMYLSLTITPHLDVERV